MAQTVHGRTMPATGDRAAGAWRAREIVVAIALLASLFYAHFGALAGMVALWNVSPMYSYGYTVPFISAYLLWVRRDTLAALTPQAERLLGIPLVAAAVALLIAGRAGGIQVLEQLAFLVSLAGTVLLVLGRRFLAASWVALAYLLLMVPLWDGLTEPLHAPFQQRSAAIGCAVLRAVGIPAHCEGTFVALPGLNIEVARACSGVNYLVAVIALGLPLAFLYLPGVWRRVVLIGSAVLVAAFSNGLRVALIALLAHFDIGSPLHGPFHILHGLFVAAIGYVVLFAGLRLLAPRQRHPRPQDPELRSDVGLSRRVPIVDMVVVTAVFVAVGAGVIAGQSEPVRLASSLETLPLDPGGWQAEFARPQSAPALWNGADATLARRYRANDGTAIDLNVAYFEAQAQNHEVASFRTAGLHRRSRPVQVPLPSGGTFIANEVFDAAGRPEALFWYELGGRTESSAYAAKLRTLVRAVTRRRSEGAAVLLSTAQSGAAVEKQLIDLGGRVRDALATHLAKAGSAPQEGK